MSGFHQGMLDRWDRLRPEDVDTLGRAELVRLLTWNDPNGSWGEPDEDGELPSEDVLRAGLRAQLEER